MQRLILHIFLFGALLSFKSLASDYVENKDVVVTFNELYNKKISKQDMIKKFERAVEQEPGVLSWKSSVDFLYVDTFFIFDDLQNIKQISYFLYPNEIDRAISVIKCNWKKNEEYKSFNKGHSIVLEKTGECLDKKISYSYEHKSGRYQIKWKWSL